MKKVLLVFAVILIGISMLFITDASAYNFGDFRSETLTTKAWQALSAKDTEAVLAYTNKCLELYAEQAKKMQDSLEGYPEGEKEKIFSYWALNDVTNISFYPGRSLSSGRYER